MRLFNIIFSILLLSSQIFVHKALAQNTLLDFIEVNSPNLNNPAYDELFIKKFLTCKVMVFGKNFQLELEETFEVPYRSYGHGGERFEFEKNGQRIVVVASGQWMELIWYQEEVQLVNGLPFLGTKRIAHGLVALSEGTVEHRVLILYHPTEAGEDVSLDCSPKE